MKDEKARKRIKKLEVRIKVLEEDLKRRPTPGMPKSPGIPVKDSPQT